MSIKLRLPSPSNQRTHSPVEGAEPSTGSGLDRFAADLLADLTQRHPLPYQPRVEWRNYRVTAGMAYWKLGVIGLSKQVLTSTEQVTVTLTHEYAHLLAVSRAGSKAANHGPHWQQAMRDLGAEPVVRHTYDVTRNQPRQVAVYRCVKCGSEFERKRRLPKRRKYVHRDCGGGLKFVALKRISPLPKA
jgi:predicted SprT family Zn-dependent metalloprotease